MAYSIKVCVKEYYDFFKIMMLYKTPLLFSNNLYLCTCSYKVPTPLIGAGPICFKILKIFDLIWQEKTN